MKKIIITAISSTAIAITSNGVFAEQPSACSSPTSIGACVYSVYEKGKTWVIEQNFKQIPDAAQLTATNTATVQVPNPKTITIPGGFGTQPQEQTISGSVTLTPMQAVAFEAKKDTSHNLTNSLSQFYYEMNKDDSNLMKSYYTAEGHSFATYMGDNSLSALSVGPDTKASDTLYSTDTSGLTTTSDINSVKKPSVTHDDYFDFGTLITPLVYTPTEQTAAKYYLKYAVQSTQNLTTGIDFTKLYKNPAAIAALKKNPAYQSYALTLRSMLALRSVSLNNLNQLIAERTSLPGLGAAAGLAPGPNNQPVAASPLQVEAYQATHRVDNPAWYTQIANDSPATLQRETLIVLAEIEKQNYEAHLDRERILATLTAENLQSSMETTKTLLIQEASKINTAIANATSSAAPEVSKPLPNTIRPVAPEVPPAKKP